MLRNRWPKSVSHLYPSSGVGWDFFVNENIIDNGLHDAWDCFLLAIIVFIIIIDRIFRNFDR